MIRRVCVSVSRSCTASRVHALKPPPRHPPSFTNTARLPIPATAVYRRSTSTARKFTAPITLAPADTNTSFLVRAQVGRVGSLAHSTMASATTFYNFKPKDSTSSLADHIQHSLGFATPPFPVPPSLTARTLTKHSHREGQRLLAVEPEWQGGARRQHSLQMRLHTAI